MGENVRVIVRCRPMSDKEKATKCQNIVDIRNCAVNFTNPNDPSAPPKTFTFDNSYDDTSNTETIYNDICYALVENVLEGYNGTIFAYGQTGCGKSHTMQGPMDLFSDNNNASSFSTTQLPEALMSQRGIISRSFDHIFEAISVASHVRFLVLVSYLEIYNENIRDLLSHQANNLTLKELPGEGVIIQNLSTHSVQNAQDCERLLAIGSKNRMVGATLMNAGSSRSHSIFTVSLEQIGTSSGLASSDLSGIKKGKLNLVDLAGSERQTKTGATGDRLKEATKINLSLSALGNVISALVDGKTKHIPYRDSKLTRLLQDSLGGNTKTLMIACISPANYNYDETLSTLRYANRAKNISNKPRINEDPKDTQLRQYQEEINKLKLMLEQSGKKLPYDNDSADTSATGGGVAQTFNDNKSIEWIEKEKIKLRNQFDAETERLRMEHEAQKLEKQELLNDMANLKEHYETQMKLLIDDQQTNNITPASGRPLPREASREDIYQRMEAIKKKLVGGERANDVKLKEKRTRKKLAAQRKLSALAQVLSRVEQTEDRDLLQGHYSDIHQELQAKSEAVKAQRLKIRTLEREVSDLQAEFQLDRADYLETIRRLEKNLKFYQQMMNKALPLLRKEGRFWDLDVIKSESQWVDDLHKWKLPEDLMLRLKLPPAVSDAFHRQKHSLLNNGNNNNNTNTMNTREDSDSEVAENSVDTDSEDNVLKMERHNRTEVEDIADAYFRPKRAAELIYQSRAFHNWKDMANRNKSYDSGSNGIGSSNNNGATGPGWVYRSGGGISSWMPSRQVSFNRTWCGSGVRSSEAHDGTMMELARQAIHSNSGAPIYLPTP